MIVPFFVFKSLILLALLSLPKISILIILLLFEVAISEIEVVFQSDKDVTFDSVAKAMAAVQSVGISKIGIVTTGYGN